jgi:hypothetical protein
MTLKLMLVYQHGKRIRLYNLPGKAGNFRKESQRYLLNEEKLGKITKHHKGEEP